MTIRGLIRGKDGYAVAKDGKGVPAWDGIWSWCLQKGKLGIAEEHLGEIGEEKNRSGVRAGCQEP